MRSNMIKIAADIGCIGLSTLSQNLILNLDDHGYVVAVFDEHTNIVAALAEHEAKNTKIHCTYSLEEMVNSLKENPRIIMLRESAIIHPTLVDDFIEKLEPLLSPGDIIVDYSHSRPDDTDRRTKDLKSKGILFVGCGINDDEDEVRRGPLLMPGGNPEAWPFIKPIFQKICSKIDGEHSCDWLGEGGIGHDIMRSYRLDLSREEDFMLEAYYLMHYRMGMDNKEISSIFAEWNTGDMKSALFETIINIIKNCNDDDDPLEVYKSKSGEVGSGMWTAAMSNHHVDMGSMFYICLCGLLKPPGYVQINSDFNYEGNKEHILKHLKNALYAATVYIYGKKVEDVLLSLLTNDMCIHNNLSYNRILRMWKGTDHTRRDILKRLEAEIDGISDFPCYDNLWSDDFFIIAIKDNLPSIREVVATSSDLRIDLLHFRLLMPRCEKQFSGRPAIGFKEPVKVEIERCEKQHDIEKLESKNCQFL